MGNHLIKTPVTAIIFAAVWHFAAVFFPQSEGYAAAIAVFKMPVLGYVYMLALGLLFSMVIALAIGAKPGVMTAVMVFAALILTQAASNLQSIVFGETSATMTRGDILLGLAALTVSMLFLLVVAVLLFKAPPSRTPTPAVAPPAAKYKIKTLDLIIKIIVLPIIYCVLYFVARHFLLWNNQDARLYYGGTEEPITFAAGLVNILLNDARQVPMALVVGLLTTAGLLPLLFQMPGKRPVYMASCVLLMAGPAVTLLIPSAIMPDSVGMANALLQGALAVVFGSLAGIMLHTSVKKQPAPAAKPVAPATPAPQGAGAGKAPRPQPAAATAAAGGEKK